MRARTARKAAHALWIHQLLSIAKAAFRIENGLLFSLFHRRQALKPCLRRAEPELIAGYQLVPLTNRADTQTNYLRTHSHRSRVDRRAAFGTERLLASVSVLCRLDVNLRRAR